MRVFDPLKGENVEIDVAASKPTRVEDLVRRLRISDSLMSSPIVTAAEAASSAVENEPGASPIQLRAAIVSLLPPNATGFEVGVALGLALALSTEPKPFRRDEVASL